MRTISVLGLRPVALALVALGYDPAPVFRRVGLDAELLADPDARLPADSALAVFAEATRLTGIATFGLRAAAAIPPDGLEVVDVIGRSSTTVGVAIERFARYYALLDDGARIEIEVEGDSATIVHVAPRMVAPPPAAVEMLFGLLVLRTRGLAGSDVPVRAVRFIHAAPPDTSEHERFFRAPVSFGSLRHELVVDRSWLDAAIATADPVVAGLAERLIRHVTAELPSSGDVVGRAQRAIADTIASGPPRLDAVASRLVMSVRTLQRKLREAGPTFAEVVDDVRREMALAQLAKRELSIAEVGYVLGFSEPSAFHRAFRRWTGRTPSEYRKDPGAKRPPLARADKQSARSVTERLRGKR